MEWIVNAFPYIVGFGGVWLILKGMSLATNEITRRLDRILERLPSLPSR